MANIYKNIPQMMVSWWFTLVESEKKKHQLNKHKITFSKPINRCFCLHLSHGPLLASKYERGRLTTPNTHHETLVVAKRRKICGIQYLRGYVYKSILSNCIFTNPTGSMYGMFTSIYHEFEPNVGKSTIPMDPVGIKELFLLSTISPLRSLHQITTSLSMQT